MLSEATATTPTHRVGVYEKFVRLSLALQSVRFSTIVVDTKLFTKDDMNKYHGHGGKDLAYLKFMRQLLKGRILRFASKDNPDHVVLYDKLPMDGKLVSEFRSYLKYDMEGISSRKGFDTRFTHLSQADSKILNLMQAADLLTGATVAGSSCSLSLEASLSRFSERRMRPISP